MKRIRSPLAMIALAYVLGFGPADAETMMEKSARLIGRRHFAAPGNVQHEGTGAPDADPASALSVEGPLYVLPDFAVKRRATVEGRDLDTRIAKLKKGFAKYPGLLVTPAQHRGLALCLLREDEDLRREADWEGKLGAIYADDANETKEMREIMVVTMMRRKRSR